MAFITSLTFLPRRTHSKQQTCNRHQVHRTTPMAIEGPGNEIHPRSEHLYETLEMPPRVGLTREQGKNEALREAIESMYSFIEVLELPCVKTVSLPDALELPKRLLGARNGGFGEALEWIVLTSPEAASVFINAWRAADCPPLPGIAAVGRATGDCIRAVGLDVAFQPSKATGRMLVEQFAQASGQTSIVLYPASRKASHDIETGLSAKGFSVQRMNTYSTELNELDSTSLLLAKDVHIVTFASPSAVKSWVDNVGVNDSMAVACIGETSARAARKAGFVQVHYPDAPGIDGWMTAVCEAMKVFENSNKGNK